MKRIMQTTVLPPAEIDKVRRLTAKYAVVVGQEIGQKLQAELAKARQ
jgi:hypothetical protein